MRSVRDDIVARRRARIASEGHSLGCRVPAERDGPVVELLRDPGIICEIKRRSPSRGDIDAFLDPVSLAKDYLARGARTVSVLTEEDYFHGSLEDLMAVKRAYPECAVLRKDFLLEPEDIAVSYRAGADAVLLIAAVLTSDELGALMSAARNLGLAVLVELHDEEDVRKARSLKPDLIGINARNLSTFNVDLLAPLRLHGKIDWEHRSVFESGIFTREDARLVARGGFDAILVGEAVVRDPNRIPEIASGLRRPDEGLSIVHPQGNFWSRLATRICDDRPLVKICGITNPADGELAALLGADILGFVFAESPRRARPEVVRALAGVEVLKAAVVVTGGSHGGVPDDVASLFREGLLDVIQFHGDESSKECSSAAFPYYRALRIAAPDDTAEIRDYGCPRVLIDARSDHAYGGTGQRLSPEVLRAAGKEGPVWLAGGLGDGNIAAAVREFRPELVDASSGLEGAPGRKAHHRLRRFFKEIENV